MLQNGKFRFGDLSMRAVHVALQVMEGVASFQPIGASELARRLALSKTTVHRSLMSLAKAGWIEPADSALRSWTLSMHSLVVGAHAIESLGGLRSVAIPVMEELRRETEETIHLLVRYRDTIVLIERLDGIKPVRVFNPLGGRARLHRVASGKAILAHVRRDDFEAYLARLAEHSGKAHARQLASEIAQVKKRGFAVNQGENQPGVSAVGAAILDNEGLPLAALTISTPSERLPASLLTSRGALVSDAARRISQGLRLRGLERVPEVRSLPSPARRRGGHSFGTRVAGQT